MWHFFFSHLNYRNFRKFLFLPLKWKKGKKENKREKMLKNPSMIHEGVYLFETFLHIMNFIFSCFYF
jgi:hypothetical protein